MRALFFLFLFLAACGRPLTPAEKSFASQLHGPSVDTSRIRAIHGSPVGAVTFERPKRPRVACRELILPEPPTDIVTVSPAAMVLHNKIFFSRDWYLEDYLKGYPEQLDLLSAMLFAHELTHIWQWQNRSTTGYSILGAAREHEVNADPYLYDIENKARFLDFGFEQQASIVEEFVCCAALDPEGQRTRRLKALLQDSFPVTRMSLPKRIFIPWKDAELDGVCS